MDALPAPAPEAEDEAEFLIEPALAPGMRVELVATMGDAPISGDVLAGLGDLMRDLQQSSAAALSIPSKPACTRLRRCGSFRGGCPNLAVCGTYAPPGTPTV